MIVETFWFSLALSWVNFGSNSIIGRLLILRVPWITFSGHVQILVLNLDAGPRKMVLNRDVFVLVGREHKQLLIVLKYLGFWASSTRPWSRRTHCERCLWQWPNALRSPACSINLVVLLLVLLKHAMNISWRALGILSELHTSGRCTRRAFWWDGYSVPLVDPLTAFVRCRR